MPIVDLADQSNNLILDQAAALLVEGFDEPRGWPTLDVAREEVESVLSLGFARGMVDAATLLGWVGGIPEYGGRVYPSDPVRLWIVQMLPPVVNESGQLLYVGL